MRKKYTALLWLLAALSLFAACTGKTPDVIAEEEAKAVTVENLTWTIRIEGADVTEYSRADAEKHPLSRIISAISKHTENDPNGVGSFTTSVMVEGVTLPELLADIGAADAGKVTFTGTDAYGEPMEFSLEGDLLRNDKILIAWIRNKTEILYDTRTYVGIFPENSVRDCPYCPSLEKIAVG